MNTKDNNSNDESSEDQQNSSEDQQDERRNGNDRRVSKGRREMIRFDETGGDRRSGSARRHTDEGFREHEDADDELDADDE